MIDGATTILVIHYCLRMCCITSSFAMSSLAPGPAGPIMPSGYVVRIGDSGEEG